MTNKELAKELLGYTYIDIQNIPNTYKMLNVDIDKFKKEYEQEDYESTLFTLMDNISAKVIFIKSGIYIAKNGSKQGLVIIVKYIHYLMCLLLDIGMLEYNGYFW